MTLTVEVDMEKMEKILKILKSWNERKTSSYDGMMQICHLLKPEMIAFDKRSKLLRDLKEISS